jgi:hypothetical protein
MNRFTTTADAKLPGTFRVLDPTGKPITAAIPENMAQRIATRRNQELDRAQRKPEPGHRVMVRIVSIILVIVAILGCLQAVGWTDRDTYALSHGQESFE